MFEHLIDFTLMIASDDFSYKSDPQHPIHT